MAQASRRAATLIFPCPGFVFRAEPLGDAALVVCYLPGPAMEKLKPKLMAELPAGALVLSNTFALRGWDAIDVRTAPDAHASQVYLYRVGDTLK